MDWVNIITNTLFGATAGYLTNNLAIKMLFKEYGPFGGVILKTKDEFIENTSALVEREIINHHSLEDKLESEEVKEVFNKIVADIFNKGIYTELKNKKLSDIDSIDKTIIKHLDFILDEKISFNKINDKYKIAEKIFNEKQLKNIVNNLYILVLNNIKEDKKDFLDEIINKLSKNKVKEIIEVDLLNKINKNIKEEITSLNTYLKDKHEIEIDQFLRELFTKLELEKVIKSTLKESMEREAFITNISEIIVNISYDNLLEILKEDKGEILFNKFIKTLINDLKNIDIKLNTLFKNSNQEKSKRFFNSEFNSLIELVKGFLDENKEEIEEIFEESLEDVLESGSGLKNSLQKFIYNSVNEGGISQYKVIEKIENFLDSKNESIDFSKKIHEFLNNKNLGDILEILYKKDILSLTKIIETLSTNEKKYKSNLKRYLKNYLEDLDYNSLVEREEFENIIYHFEDSLISLIKSEYIYNEKLNKKLITVYDKAFSKLKEKEIAEIIDSDLVNSNFNQLKDIIVEKLDENQNQNIEKISRFLNDKIKNKRVGKNVSIKKEKIIKTTKVFLENKKDLNLNKIIKVTKNNNEVTNKLSDSILNITKVNLADIIEGRIEEAVSGSLNQLDDSKIQEVVEDFVGEELKPITLFGGGLGAFGGLALYFLNDFALLNSLSYSSTFLTILIYGLIGYLTNVIALWMLFHPYEEKNIFSKSVPLTPGVVSQNKDRFANSMAKFVDEKLLDANSVSDIFDKKSDEISHNIFEYIAENNYSKIQKLLAKNTKNITEEIEDNLFYYLENNKENISEFLSEKFLNIGIKEIEFIRDYIDLNNLFAPQVKKNFLKSFTKEVRNKVFSEKNLSGIIEKDKNNLLKRKISDFIKNNLDIIIENFSNIDIVNKFDDFLTKGNKNKVKANITSFINEDKILNYGIKLLDDNINKFFTQEKKFSAIIPDLKDNKEKISNSLTDFVYFYLDSNRDKLKLKLQEIIKEEISEKSGSFLGAIMLNLSGFDELSGKFVDDLIDKKLSPFLKEHKDELYEKFLDYINALKNKEIKESAYYYQKNSLLEYSKYDYEISSDLNSILNFFFDKIFTSSKDIFIKIDSDKKKILQENIKFPFEKIEQNINKNKNDILDIANENVYNILYARLEEIKLRDIFTDVDYRDINKELNYLFTKLEIEDTLKETFINQLLADSSIRLGDFLDEKDLNEALINIWEENKEEVINSFNHKIPAYIDNLIELTDEKTLDYLNVLFIKVTIDSLKNNFRELVNSFDINEITKREINDMKAEEIEDLFYSFAGKYLKRLKLYGWSGGSFGILSEILASYFLK
ncbi:MAG: DUF445 family protein [Bacillota bacterium]